MVSKYCLHPGGLDLIPNNATTVITATTSGNAEHVSLNHRLASPSKGVKLVTAKPEGRTVLTASPKWDLGLSLI